MRNPTFLIFFYLFFVPSLCFADFLFFVIPLSFSSYFFFEMSVSSSSDPESRGQKRNLSEARDDVVWFNEIDAVGTFLGIVELCGGNQEALAKAEEQIGASVDSLNRVRTLLRAEKLARHGDVFQCTRCESRLDMKHRMCAFGGPIHHKQAKFDEARSSLYCYADVCFECALACGLVCPECNCAIDCWLDGPAPYLIVLDRRASKRCWGNPVRLELDPEVTTLRQLAQLLEASVEQFSIHGERCDEETADWKLVQFGVDCSMFKRPAFNLSSSNSIILRNK